jgi:signal transduction histidine kinase
VVFPLALAYALLRYRLLDTDYIVGQAVLYGALLAAGLAAYALIVSGVSLLAGVLVGANNPLVLALLVIALVIITNPLRDRLQALVNDVFFRGTRAYRQRLQAFGRALTRAVALADICKAVDEQVQGALRPAHLYLFLRDRTGGDFGAYAGPPGAAAPVTELRFAADGALVTALTRERAALYFSPDSPLPAHLLPDRARLTLLGSTLHAPLHGQSGLAGWLAVGPKLSGQPLTREDVRFVEALADQAALAVERATVISDLEHRVRELNVLSQMSQAVNFTLAYDDLLELIYAQASKVVDTRNFYILLDDGAGLNFSYALFVENDERETGEENKPFPVGRGLASEIRRTGQSLRTDHYAEECRRRNVAGRGQPYTAWMGVPLNAGADTIGVMVVASFEAGATFAEDQLRIFGAIADQAASALVRARLYLKSEERARQLGTLNELSTSMASDLELDPLLTRIVHSSMDMLVCEAGSLFLTDTDTGEYVFRVAAGPVGQNLVGLRIARGKGFVGEAIEGGQVIIVNDVQNDPRWFKGSDQSTGFVTRAVMVVPLRRGGRIIGALEVINKRDGTPFDDEDRTLLTAFAGQAAVAIENARLFAQTDQALTERVEELSVMQRIDRELNEALDVKRVMDITLSYAMANSHASAGSVGMVTEGGIQIIATHGYGDTVEQLSNRPLPIGRGIMGRVVRTGRMNLVRDVRADPDYRGILPATRSQLTIPIMREGIVVGLINLESPETDAFTDEQVAFVTRLLDHAAVAITNARLYSEVAAANIAKSEFVSVAAHELKTPMTAIKMSAELMLSGAVGATNDTQKQFLTTIRNNLDRMTTIVSDLNDITRIETGRLLLDIKPLKFQGVVDEVVHATRGLIEAKQQTLTVEVEPNLPPVLADLNRASQVLTNLLSNANKYTPDTGTIVLRIRSTPDDQQVHISVQDSGIGISEEDQRRLFTKFFRSEDRAARDMAPGTGLGLSIVKNLVELQGGRIWAESEYRRGSTFHFTLPLAEPAPQPAPAVGAD